MTTLYIIVAIIFAVLVIVGIQVLEHWSEERDWKRATEQARRTMNELKNKKR